MTKMAVVTQAKSPFAKSTVDNPDLSGSVFRLPVLQGMNFLRVPNTLGNGISLPLAQNSKKQRDVLIFRCRYLPGIRLRKNKISGLGFYTSGKKGVFEAQ